jgi:PAS domain S-box-containing protein
MRLNDRPFYVRYGIAVAAVIVAVAAILTIRLVFTLNPTPLILIAVIVASWFGGRFPGLLTVVLADLSIDYFFETPQYQFDLSPVHFVRLMILGVISILASGMSLANERLKTRARQQEAVALFGQDALSSMPPKELLPKAAQLINDTLGVRFSTVCDLVEGTDRLRILSSAGWSEDVDGHEFSYSDERSAAGHILRERQALVIRDFRKEKRFDHSPLIQKNKIVCMAGVPIVQREESYGVIGAFDTSVRDFTTDDIYFLQSIANVIAEATGRLRSEEEIREQRTWLRTTLSSIGDGVIATDQNGSITFMNPTAEALSGWQEVDAVGRPLDEVFRIINEATGESVISPVEKVISTGEVVGLANHTVLLAKDGRKIPIDDSAAPIKDRDNIRGIVLVFSDVTQRKLAEKARREAEMMQRIVEAQESERNRIARDLHDHLGQQMTALRLRVESIVKEDGVTPELRVSLSDVQKAADRIDQDISFLSWELRPTELEALGLEDALASFIREWSRQYDIEADFHAELPAGRSRLDKDLETNIYRIVQEGLNNIVKHADASKASVMLQQRGGEMVLVIEDDGQGFGSSKSEDAGPQGMGLTGMRERTALHNGTFEVESVPDEGTTLIARIPLK